MNVFALIMYVLALVCFLFGAFGSTRAPHVNLIALGLAFAVTPTLVSAADVVL